MELEQTIYADILFAVNFSMDFFALYVTNFMLKLRFSLKRCIASAILGAIYGVISVVTELGFAVGLVATATVGIFMCVILNGYSGIKLLAKEITVFLSANMLIGGGMTVVYEYFNAHGGADNILIYGSAETLDAQLPAAIFIVAGGVISVILLCFSRGISRSGTAKRAVLRIEHNGRSVTSFALTDSGNLLTEPISGLPVIILRKATASRLLEPSMIAALTELKYTDALSMGNKFRFILYESVSGKGMLAVFMPERIEVNGVSVAAWIGISDKISGKINGVDEAIVPSSLAC